MITVGKLKEIIKKFDDEDEVVVDSNNYDVILDIYKCEKTGKMVILITE